MNDVLVMLPIEPVPKLRPRFKIVRGKVFTHTPEKTKEFENKVAAMYLEKTKQGMFECHKPLSVSITFCLEIPKSFTKKKRTDIESGILQHTVKPDLDNLTKAILDALNGIAWNDDAQIVNLNVHKEYSSGSGYISIYIKQL